MSQTPDLSPRAQAILRAIENEAQARRQNNAASVGDQSGQPIPSAPMTAPPVGDATDRLMGMVDHVVAQTEYIRAHVKQVEQSLDALSEDLAKRAAPQAAAPGPVTMGRSGDPRLIAIELALSGKSRGEVEERLVQDLGMSDAEPILNDVFGTGSADSKRMPWNS